MLSIVAPLQENKGLIPGPYSLFCELKCAWVVLGFCLSTINLSWVSPCIGPNSTGVDSEPTPSTNQQWWLVNRFSWCVPAREGCVTHGTMTLQNPKSARRESNIIALLDLHTCRFPAQTSDLIWESKLCRLPGLEVFVNPTVNFTPMSTTRRQAREAISYSVALDDLSGGSHNTTMMPNRERLCVGVITKEVLCASSRMRNQLTRKLGSNK